MSPISTRQKVGLALAGVMSVINIPSVFFPAPDGDEGPPLAVLAVNSVLGIIGLVAVIIAWRSGNKAAIRVAAGTLILNAITSLPAFFVDVPAGLKAVVGVSVLVTVATVVLMFSPARRPAPVLD